MAQNENPTLTGHPSKLAPGSHRFAHEAMATVFEIFIADADPRYAEQAAWAAFERIDRLEQDLSRFIESSDIARLGRQPAGAPLRLGRDAFECLAASKRVGEATDGAFDVTVGALVDLWREPGRLPTNEEIELARSRTGTHLIALNEANRSATLRASSDQAESGTGWQPVEARSRGRAASVGPLRIDLGGIGKGYALDRAAALLGDWSLGAALLLGGRSSVLALDAPARATGWPVTLTSPVGDRRALAEMHARNCAVSGSGLQRGPHIIDPRTGRPVEGTVAAWSLAPTAAEADALSTAFMVMRPEEIERYCRKRPDVSAMIIRKGTENEVLRFGDWSS
jgi:thiamine biosynthesis lipoprotein